MHCRKFGAHFLFAHFGKVTGYIFFKRINYRLMFQHVFNFIFVLVFQCLHANFNIMACHVAHAHNFLNGQPHGNGRSYQHFLIKICRFARNNFAFARQAFFYKFNV